MVNFNPVFRANTGYPIQVAQSSSPSQNENTVIVDDKLLRKVDLLINTLEQKVIEMERSGHPNAPQAREKLVQAKGYQKRLENLKGATISLKAARQLIGLITTIDNEIMELGKPIPAFPEGDNLRWSSYSDSNEAVQLHGIENAAEINTEKATDFLIDAVSHSKFPEVRAEAIFVLGSGYPAHPGRERAIPVLLSALSDPAPIVRREAARALAEIENTNSLLKEKVVVKLIDIAKNDPGDPLAWSGDKKVKIGDTTFSVRASAISSLHKLLCNDDPKRLINILIEILETTDVNKSMEDAFAVKQAALYLSVMVKSMDIDQAARSYRALSKVVDEIKTESAREDIRVFRSDLKKYLIEVRNKIVDEHKKDSLAPLPLQNASSSDDSVAVLKSQKSSTQEKLAAIDNIALNGTGDKNEFETLKNIRVSKSEDPDVKSMASILLGSTGKYRPPQIGRGGMPTQQTVEFQKTILPGTSIDEWRKVLLDVGNTTDERMYVILHFQSKTQYYTACNLLEGNDPPEVKLIAINSVEKGVMMHPPRSDVYEALLKVATNEPNVWVRCRALYSLRGITPEQWTKEVLELCVKALESDSYYERYNAIRTLGQLQHPSALVVLAKENRTETDPELKAEIEKWAKYQY